MLSIKSKAIYIAGGGEREQQVLVCIVYNTPLLFTDKTRQWKKKVSKSYNTRHHKHYCLLCSFPFLLSKSFHRTSFALKVYKKYNSSPAHCGASLHCCWDTVAAPVADVNGKRRHAISRPIGPSPLHAIIGWRCSWKKMIMGALSSLQQLIIIVMYFVFNYLSSFFQRKNSFNLGEFRSYNNCILTTSYFSCLCKYILRHKHDVRTCKKNQRQTKKISSNTLCVEINFNRISGYQLER